MSHRDEVERAAKIGFMESPWMFIGLFMGSFVLLLPLQFFALQALGIDPAIFKDGERLVIYSAFLGAVTAASTRPSGARTIFLAVLGGGGVAVLFHAGAIGMELLASRGEIPGAVAHFALRVGIMIPALTLAALTIYGLAPAAPLPVMAMPAPIHLISALTMMVVLHAAAQAIWREGSSAAFLVAIMPAMAMINARPRGMAAWVHMLGVVVAAFALMLGGFMLGAWAEQRWSGGSTFLIGAIMLAAILPPFLLAMAMLFRLHQLGLPNPATKPEGGEG